jgi:hypothetical protein
VTAPASPGSSSETYKISIYYGALNKAELEKEFGLPGNEAEIGTGASGPGLVFLIDIGDLIAKYGGWALLVLSKPKDITEVVTFYVAIAKRLAKYVNGRHAYLERDGAYALGVNALVEHLGGLSKSIVLDGYMVGDYAGGGWDDMVELTEIGEAPRHTGAFVPHHFQFEIDGKKRIKVVVGTDAVKVFELPPPKKPRRRSVSSKRPAKKNKSSLRKAKSH